MGQLGVVTQTRETRTRESLNQGYSGLHSETLVGGLEGGMGSIREQETLLEQNVQVAVAR